MAEKIANDLKEKKTESPMAYLMAVSEQTSMAEVIGEDNQKDNSKSKIGKKKGGAKK